MTANILNKSHQIREIQTNYSKREGRAWEKKELCKTGPAAPSQAELKRSGGKALLPGIHSHRSHPTPRAGGNSQEKAPHENGTFWAVTKMGRENASPARYPNARPLWRKKNGEKEVRY